MIYELHHSQADRTTRVLVVRAASPKAARAMSANYTANPAWTDPAKSSCRRLTEDGPAQIILDHCHTHREAS